MVKNVDAFGINATEFGVYGLCVQASFQIQSSAKLSLQKDVRCHQMHYKNIRIQYIHALELNRLPSVQSNISPVLLQLTIRSKIAVSWYVPVYFFEAIIRITEFRSSVFSSDSHNL